MRRISPAVGLWVVALVPQAALVVQVVRLKKALRNTKREKDEFLATLSHELRTPLNAILGWIQLLRMHIDKPDDRRHALDVIERNARRQASVVGDLLDMSRIVTGTLQLAREVVSLDAVARDAVSALRDTAAAHRLTVTVDAAAGVRVTGDRERLRQVVAHLLSNAVKFTPPGGHIRLRVGADAESAVIDVSDTGIGVAADLLPHLFNSFHQAERGLTRRYGGLGLGLTLAKTLVELHGGTVEARSSGPGRGATFTVRLPRARAGAYFAG